jgi:hypothetical protein
MTTSADLMGMLKASMHPPSRPSPGYVVGELNDPTGNRRADALFVPLGHATRGQIHGYEFKVSRSDLIVELRDPMKADPWLRYCTYWRLFVSDPAIIAGLEIPEEWGIVAPPKKAGRALTVIRPAPKLKPVAGLPAFLVICARLYYGDGPADERIKNLTQQLERSRNDADTWRTTALEAQRDLRQLDPAVKDADRDLVNGIVQHIRAKYDYPSALEMGAERLGDLLRDTARLERLRDELAEADERALADLEMVHRQRGARLQHARDQLEGRRP